ncbi:hypothetical protein MMC07_004476 [Pseudocyphellaria aurata]|nr:hypothetical protein [Pseudocyphellaria aurata]
MLFFPASSKALFFVASIVFFNAIILIRCKVVASASASDQALSTAEQPSNDYPSDEDIQKAFKGVDRDGTVVFADLEGRIQGPYQFAKNLGKQWILDAFRDNPDGTIFIHRNGRSKEGYQDFAERYSRTFLQASSGVIWLISRFPGGPRIMWDCSFWWAFEFVLLRDNPNVEAIVLVDENDFTSHRILWPQENDEPGERKQPEDHDPPNGNAKWPLNGGALERFGAGSTTGVSVLGAGAGVVLPVLNGFEILPGLGIFAPEGTQSQDTDTDQDSGTEGDVLDHVIGDLPPAEVLAAEEQRQDKASSVEVSDSWPIFGRRSISLQSRGLRPIKICYDWNNDPNNPDFPAFPLAARIEISNVIIASTPPEADSTIRGELDSGIGTIKVTQYQRQFPLLSVPGRSKVDLSVLDSEKNIIGIAFKDPPDSQAVTVWCHVASFAIYVWVGSLDTDPLQFMLGERGNSWRSDDQSKEHQCTTSQWTHGSRKVECQFAYLS